MNSYRDSRRCGASAKFLRALTALLLSTNAAIAATHYYADFDSTNPGKKELSGGQIDIVDNPSKDKTNSSDKVARCRVNDGGKRAEYSSQRLATNEKRYVYRWMYYIPAGFASAPLGWRILSQWKTWPCEVCTNYANEICYGCGGIFDEARVSSGKFQVVWRAKPDCIISEKSLITGRWVSFVMEIYWTNTSNGYARLWIDSVLIGEHKNIKTLFDRFPSDGSCNIYWGVGLYGGLNGAPYADVYIDNISISDVVSAGAGESPRFATASTGLQVRSLWAAGNRMPLTLRSATGGRVLTVHALDGSLVRRITLGAPAADGSASAVWDGRDSRGREVGPGPYLLSVEPR